MNNALTVSPAGAELHPPMGLAAEPQFAFRPGATVIIEGKIHAVERRVGGNRWQFIGLEDNGPLFLADSEIANLLKQGKFFAEGGRGKQVFAAPPISPIAIGEKAHEHNLRKHSYVTACLATGEVRRSRGWLMPAIKKVAIERSENPPGFSTVLLWLDEYERFGEMYGTAAYSDRHDLKGCREGRLLPHQERAIEEGIEAWFKLGKKTLAYDVVCESIVKFDREKGRSLDKGAIDSKYVDRHGRLRPPSIRTFERRVSALNHMLADWGRKGPSYAKQKNRTWQTTILPDRPYAEVEVDHNTLDLIVIDPSGLVLGRPDVIVFRDRATAMILGYGLGFEAPSYASFVQGLKHAMYPKDLSGHPAVKNGWPCFGRIENLYVDNALHFLGDNIKAAGRELNFNIVRLQPRQPWLKGGLERFFGSLNAGLVHSLPGTTLQNILARNDNEHLGEATLTLAEFDALLTYWICEIYHADIRKALGPFRGAGDRPLSVWQEKVKTYKTALPPSPDVFMSLAGDIEYRTIQKDGISWDKLKYESEELWAVLSHPSHQRRSDGSTTRYKVVRDPMNLGSISLVRPWDKQVITVPATLAYRKYATGLTLHQHNVVIANVRSRNGNLSDVAELQAAKSQLAAVVTQLRQHPGRKKTVRAMARYLDGQVYRRLHSEIDADPSVTPASDFMELPSSVTRIVSEPSITAQTGGYDKIWADEEEDDFERLRKTKNWVSYQDE